MIKTKAKNKKSLLLKTFGLASLTLLTFTMFPMKAEAVGSVPIGKTKYLEHYNNEKTIKYFTSADSRRHDWYTRNGRSNYVFLDKYKGLKYYSPIAPPSAYSLSNNRGQAQNYDNNYNDCGSGNFKTKTSPLNDVTWDHLSNGGGMFNIISPYKGEWGEWRYIGYSSFGNPVQNPYFPSDVDSPYATPGSYPYDPSPWAYNRGCQGKASSWDNIDGLDPDLYKQKLESIRKLLIQEPTMKHVTSDTKWWAKHLSLRTDPEYGSAVFLGTRDDGSYYRSVVLRDNDDRNLRIVSEVVIDKSTGKEVGSFTRNEWDEGVYEPTVRNGKLQIGGEYEVQVTVKNMSKKQTVTNPSETIIGMGYGSAFKSNALGFSDNQFNNPVRIPETYAPGEEKTFKDSFVVGANFGKGIRFTGLLGNEHNLREDNIDHNDDDSVIYFQVMGGGNFGVDLIKLIDKNGVAHDKATPGEDYKVQYHVTYTGDDIKEAIYTWCEHKDGGHWRFDHWYYPPVDISLISEIDRNIPPVHGFADVRYERIAKTSEVHNGNDWYYTTPSYQTYEVPVIKATGTVPNLSIIKKSSDYDLVSDFDFDSNGADNEISAEFHELYDLSVSNLQIKPVTETPYSAGYQTYAVQYTVNSKAPNWLTTYEKDVKTMVALGGQQVSFVDHVAKGENKLITHEMKVWIDPSKDKTITGDVFINYDRMVWEEDVLNQRNNKTTGKADIKAPFDPHNGPPVQRTNNTWTQNYNVHYWTGNHKTYYAVDGSSHEFNNYSSAGDRPQNISQNENYKITSILFRSKLTTDTQQGANRDGWVELTNPGAVGAIKAGYGYELKMTVNYNTNAFSQPEPNVNGAYSQNGNWVRPYNVTPNLPKQLFVKTPDNKILSVDGYCNTNAGLTLSSETGDYRTNQTWVYTIKSKDTLGIKSTPKIFVDENTKDGTYNLQVFTPVINGVPTKTSGSPLCDSKTVQIKVQGSDTDDLKSHITQ